MIRCAGVEDIPAIIEMVGQYRCEVRPDLEMHPGTVAASVRGLITQPTGCALLACDGGACPHRGNLHRQERATVLRTARIPPR